MAVKHFYLVRHGETADNRRWVHQAIGVSLNERGAAEAEAAARELAALRVDTLLTSDARRAQETADHIARATHLEPRVDPVLRELHRGVLIEGEHHLSWASIKGSVLLFLRADDRAWHFGDGENALEFRDRLARISGMLAEMSGERIVVVTHRGVINGLRFGIRHGFSGSIRCLLLAAVFGRIRNGGIVHLTCDPSSRTPAWRVEQANDTRHLRD